MPEPRISYIQRTEEIRRLHNLMISNNYVLLLGQKGIGKSQLARDYIDEFVWYYQKVNLFMSFGIEAENDIWAGLREASTGVPNLLVVDGLDNQFVMEDCQRLLQFIKQARSLPIKILILSRGTEQHVFPFLQQGLTTRLYGLQPDEVAQLILQITWRYDIPPDRIEAYARLANAYDGNPSAIQDLIQQISQNFEESKLEELIEDPGANLITKVNYSNNLITTPLVSDIRIVNGHLLEFIKKDPKRIYTLPPFKFEELVADIFNKKGYHVTRTKATRDGGNDIFLLEHNELGKHLYLMECKRYHETRAVGVSVIRQLHGTVDIKRATAGIVVTSSYFSRPAIELQKTIEHKINLIDFNALKKIIATISDPFPRI